MFFPIVLSYIMYALLTAFTPGPNNLLALYSVSREGWERGRAVCGGIAAGFFCVMLLCAAACYWLVSLLPVLLPWLRYAGAAYIALLAWQVAASRPGAGLRSGAGFWQAFGLQFVNVKIWMYAVTIYTAYVLPAGGSWQELVRHALVLTLVGVSGVLTWGLGGSLLQRFFARGGQAFNYGMGALLLLCAVQLLRP